MFNNAYCFHTGASSDNTATYIIPRPAPGTPSGFTTILGGMYEPHVWDTSLRAADARGILARCAALQPAVAAPETRVLGHNVGLRPARKGGPRVEAAPLRVPLPAGAQWLAGDVDPGARCAEGEVLVVHAYGFG